MIKFFLVIAAILFILVLSSSPAQIEYMLETGTPFYTILWMTPLFAAIIIYASFRRTNIEDDFKINMEGSKGGVSSSEIETEENINEDKQLVFHEDGSKEYIERINDEE